MTVFTDFASRVENLAELDGPAEQVVALISGVMPAEAKDALSGRWLGHPAHPMLVLVPIGAWTSATLLDFVAPRSGRDAAQRLIGLGILAAVPAAASGASDFTSTRPGPARRVGLVHALGNYAALGLFTASWWARRRDRHLRGRLFALTGAGLVTLTGYLGGHLAYVYGVGVETSDPQPTLPSGGAEAGGEPSSLAGTGAVIDGAAADVAQLPPPPTM